MRVTFSKCFDTNVHLLYFLNQILCLITFFLSLFSFLKRNENCMCDIFVIIKRKWNQVSWRIFLILPEPVKRRLNGKRVPNPQPMIHLPTKSTSLILGQINLTLRINTFRIISCKEISKHSGTFTIITTIHKTTILLTMWMQVNSVIDCVLFHQSNNIIINLLCLNTDKLTIVTLAYLPQTIYVISLDIRTWISMNYTVRVGHWDDDEGEVVK